MDTYLDFDDRKKYEEFYNLIGCKIRFKCDGYMQEGEIKVVKPNAKRITMNNVYFILPDKKIFSGTLKYRFDDLANYEVIATSKELNPYPRFEYLENILKGNDVSKKYSLNDVFYDGYLSESEEEEEESQDKKEDEFQFNVPSHLEKKVPQDFVTVDCFDLEWKQAIKHIKLQKTIGVSFHGAKVTRLGKLSWMCVSTAWCVFLFDIEKLGTDAFSNGLKSILESKQIKKVIHDCRFPSDCLAHKFDTKLANVFDTLVADFVVSMQCYNDKHKYEYIQCLNSCLRIYLDVCPEFSYAQDKYKQNSQNDIYSKRPLNNALKSILIKDTIYLLELHEVLAQKLLGPLHRNVNRYLKVIAGASKQELETLGNEISSPDCIPASLLMHGIQTVKYNKLEQKGPVSLRCKFLDPTTGKEITFKKQTAREIESNHSASSAEKALFAQNYSREKSCNLVKGRQDMCPDLKEKKSYTSESLCLNKKSVIVDKMIAPTSLRHMDEVYHKLANSKYFDSKNTESIINIKPSKNYESKFTMRIPLECSAFSNRDSCEIDDFRKIDFSNTSTSSSLMISNASNYSPDCSDIWAKLREVSSDESNVLQNAKKSSNIKFVPAGMPVLKDNKSCVTASLNLNKKPVILGEMITTPSPETKLKESFSNECNVSQKAEKSSNINFVPAGMSVVKDKKNCTTESAQSNKKSVIVDKMVATPNSQTYTDFSNPFTSSSVRISNASDSSSDCSDIWAKLREASSDESNVLQNAKKCSNIKFVPAGMPVLKDKKSCVTASLNLNKKPVILGEMITTPSPETKLKEAFNNERNVSQKAEKSSDINFVPASMSVVKDKKNCTTESAQLNKKSVMVDKMVATPNSQSYTDFSNPFTISSVRISKTSDSLSDYSDTWAKLNAACSDEYYALQDAKKPSNIKFVPAGMSC